MGAVTEYINEYLPTFDALGDLDNIVSSLEDQRSSLATQIQELQSQIDTECDRLLSKSDAILNQVQDFRTNYSQLKSRLAVPSNGLGRLNSPSAAAAAGVVIERPQFLDQLQRLMDKLQRFEIAKRYFATLEEVLVISEQAKESIVKDTRSSLDKFNQLSELAKSVNRQSHEAEDSAGYLVQYLEESRDELWKDLRESLALEFRPSLDIIGWPRQVSMDADFVGFIEGFNKLLEFQFLYHDEDSEKQKAPKPIIALSVMVEPLDIRFRYHFEGSRETNNISRPEWFFQHFQSTIEEHEQLMQTVVQGILEQSEYVINREAMHEFIYAYLPCIRRKLEAIIPRLMSEHQLLSHLMLETMKFDDYLRDVYLFRPYGLPDDQEWQGVTGDIMSRSEWFQSWLSIEKDFALARYQEIIDAPDAWVVDFDAVGDNEPKPTKSSLRLKDLLETISDRYRPLRSFVHRVRFLLDIQIAILDGYHKRISASLDAFESLTSTLGKAMSGVHDEDRKKMVDGLAGIERLCRAYGSAYTIRDALKDWGEDIFFLELYQELDTRAAQFRRQGAAKTPLSSSADSTELQKISQQLPDTLDDDGTIFDEVIKAYDAVQSRAEGLIIKHLQREVQKVYKTDKVFRQSVKSKEADAEEIYNSQAQVSEMLAYLSRALSETSFARISRTLYQSFNF